jgi:hypothetical protein
MTEHLETPLTHRLIESPLGRLLYLPLVERLKVGAIDSEFTVLRARAIADVAGTSVDRFCEGADIPSSFDDDLVGDLQTALESHAETKATFERVHDEWTAAFWGETEHTLDDRTQLEKRHREAAENWLDPQGTFGFIAETDVLDPVGFDVPEPEAALATWEDRPAADVYGLPSSMPTVESSATMHGPGTRECLVRFPSPSPFVDGTAVARVYEPFEGDRDAELSTIVYGTGLAMACDLIGYWTEEEYVGRALAQRGYRVILPIPPWHGRREIPGFYSGEPYLARMPVSAIELYATQAAETAVLTDWARSIDAPTVGVGGISLGGIVTTFVASHADGWPEACRPDFAVPVAPSARIDDLLFDSSLTERLGVVEALRESGWTPESMGRLGHLLRAQDSPGIDPERIYPVGGLTDEMTQYQPTKAVFEEWDVPETNFTEWDCGHFGVLLRVMRTREFQHLLTNLLDEPRLSSGVTTRRASR